MDSISCAVDASSPSLARSCLEADLSRRANTVETTVSRGTVATASSAICQDFQNR